MDTKSFYLDLQFLLQHIYVEPEIAVHKWTNISCKDYQIPLALISGLLVGFDLPHGGDGLRLRDIPEHLAVKEIVTNSSLSLLLEASPDGSHIRYRENVPMKLKEEIARFVGENSSGCSLY